MAPKASAWRPTTRAQLDSAALVADGARARADAYVSLAVIASAAAVALGVAIADPLIGFAITVLILRITVHFWRTVRSGLEVPTPDRSAASRPVFLTGAAP
jgi:divalent metal cation (Fe/Co/Zn/Cd) transporter